MMRSSSTIWRGGNRCGVPLFERGRWRRVSEPREAARNRRLRAVHGSPAEQATIDRGRAEDRRVPKPDRVLAPHRALHSDAQCARERLWRRALPKTKAPEYAFGHAGPKAYGDSVALLTGEWPSNQSVEVVVEKRAVFRYPEVSIRLRSSLAMHNCDGYEISYSLKDGDAAYLIIVRWNGPLADFTYLLNVQGKQYAVKTGDVVKATVVGNEIKTYKNGLLMGATKDGSRSEERRVGKEGKF